MKRFASSLEQKRGPQTAGFFMSFMKIWEPIGLLDSRDAFLSNTDHAGSREVMDAKELNGRLLAIEALLTELILKMPVETGRAVINGALPALQRVDSSTTTHSTDLVQSVSRRIRD